MSASSSRYELDYGEVVVILYPTAVEIWKKANCVTLSRKEWRALIASIHVINQCISAGSGNRLMLVERGRDNYSSYYITVENYRDEMYIDIRKWYTDSDDNFLPTRQGVKLNVNQWEELTSVSDCVTTKLKYGQKPGDYAPGAAAAPPTSTAPPGKL